MIHAESRNTCSDGLLLTPAMFDRSFLQRKGFEQMASLADLSFLHQDVLVQVRQQLAQCTAQHADAREAAQQENARRFEKLEGQVAALKEGQITLSCRVESAAQGAVPPFVCI